MPRYSTDDPYLDPATAIHRYLFSDLYEWAEQLRTVDITKGSTRFAHHGHIENGAAPIFRQLAKENHLAGFDSATFSERAAYYLGELNALHPFRGGNGRALREFISQVGQANRYYIAWENISQTDMLDAAIQSFSGNTAKLARLIRENLSR
jgi:cell filamentation protein